MFFGFSRLSARSRPQLFLHHVRVLHFTHPSRMLDGSCLRIHLAVFFKHFPTTIRLPPPPRPDTSSIRRLRSAEAEFSLPHHKANDLVTRKIIQGKSHIIDVLKSAQKQLRLQREEKFHCSRKYQVLLKCI